MTNWIQKPHKFPTHLHALDIKEAQTQRCPGVEQLRGMKTTQLLDKYIVKRNRTRNECTLLKNIGEEGIQHYPDKLEEIMRACDKLLHTWKTHGSPLADRKAKETMLQKISKTADELEQWRENSNTDSEDTLTSLTQIETSREVIKEMDAVIQLNEEEAAIEFPSLLKLLTTTTRIFGNDTHIREWWYEVMTESPPPWQNVKINKNEWRRDSKQRSGQHAYHKKSTSSCSGTCLKPEPPKLQ